MPHRCRLLSLLAGPVVAVSDLTASIRKRHTAYVNDSTEEVMDFCGSCAEDWPCGARQAADRIDQLEAELFELKDWLLGVGVDVEAES